ncbi:hypothetical protein LLA49_003630 [Salmonella enterica]|nr:hypothetical protein [Salmonella enterica]EIL1177579.1 hypothetical protein [Salmonella enterica]
MSSMVIFILLMNLLAFTTQVAEPGFYSFSEFSFLVLASIAVGLMHHYARDRENHDYTFNLWIADWAALLICLVLLWLGFDLLLHPAKHEVFIQKTATTPFKAHRILIFMMAGLTALNLVGLYGKLKRRVSLKSEHNM